MLKHSVTMGFVILFLSSCTSFEKYEQSPYQATVNLYDQSTTYDAQAFIHQLYMSRNWVPGRALIGDPITLSHAAATPINKANVKVIGVSFDEAVTSLATKLWLIDNAEHTLDLTYYIFRYDIVGEAILGALCNAVKRGVDVRIMVDSLGSLSAGHEPMRALETCAENADFIKDVNGKPTPYKARIQFVIINAVTSPNSWANRRSHDKLIIKDGHFLGKDITITGGRNISLDYYGIDQHGNRNPNAFLDLEVALQSTSRHNNQGNEMSIGEVSSIYYSLLFLHKGNRRIRPFEDTELMDSGSEVNFDKYRYWRRKAQRSLAQIMASPNVKAAYNKIPVFLDKNDESGNVRLSHQLENFTSTNVVENAKQIKAQNANSIEGILKAAIEQVAQSADRNTESVLRIVSPYIFSPQYKDKNGKIIYDGAKALQSFLNKFPNIRVEIITNSILTSDNYFTQSVIDMDTAPRLILPEALRKTWTSSLNDSELNPAYVNSESWLAAVNNDRIKIYQTGLADSTIIGGHVDYGKLHAKFFFNESFGFVGTSNFDYRSRLYNNEMGYYFQDKKVSKQLLENYNALKAISLRWGSPEWLAMRKAVFNSSSDKTFTSKSQRARFKVMKNTGLIWLF